MLLTGQNLFKEIARVTAGSSVSCAVAFWGYGSESIFKDQNSQNVRVICNLRMGGTNPFAIIALQKKGVAVRHLDALHAKVYIGNENAVITSANASKNGLGLDNGASPVWLEAGVIVSSQMVISWFNSLWDASDVVQSSDLGIALREFSRNKNKNKIDSPDEEAAFGRSLLNMSVRRATAAVLSRTRRPMTAVQIAEVLTAAGFETVSSPYRAVYEALRGGLRREFVHLERGLWAHSDWPEYAEYTLSKSEAARLDRVRRFNVETSQKQSDLVKAALEAAKRRGVVGGAVFKVTPEKMLQIQSMFSAGVTYPKIASEMGLSEPTIKRALKRGSLRRLKGRMENV